MHVQIEQPAVKPLGQFYLGVQPINQNLSKTKTPANGPEPFACSLVKANILVHDL